MVDNPVYPERTDRLLDLPEARVSTGGGRKDSLVPGIKNEHLMIAGIAVSGLLSLVALSQTQGVQNLLKRFTNPRAAQQQQQDTMPDNAGEPINITPSRVNQQQGFQVVSNPQQEAQARAIAAQIQAQEQQHHHQHAEPQPNANMYDQIGPNTIRVDPGRARQQYRYGSPFGANISTN